MQSSEKIKIAVCDDVEIVGRELSRMIEGILSEQNIAFDIQVFWQGKQLIERAADFDVVFLDIDMPQLNGIETGREVLRRNSECRIIIASGREDRFKETYELETLRFVSKPFAKKEVKEAIRAFLKRRIGMELLEVYKDRMLFRIRQRDIRYIRAYNGYVEIATDGAIYRKDISLGTLETELNKLCFFRIHRKYIVNLLWITDYTGKTVCINELELPISRRKQTEFEEIYMTFDVEYR